MKFYIASRLENAETVSRVARVLKAAGHTHTYDWTTHGSVQNEGVKRLTEVAEAEREGVLDADVVIVILPGGRGTHAELGLALGSYQRQVIICAEDTQFFEDGDRTCSFYWSDNIIHVVGGMDFWLARILQVMRCSTCYPVTDHIRTTQTGDL